MSNNELLVSNNFFLRNGHLFCTNWNLVTPPPFPYHAILKHFCSLLFVNLFATSRASYSPFLAARGLLHPEFSAHAQKKARHNIFLPKWVWKQKTNKANWINVNLFLSISFQTPHFVECARWSRLLKHTGQALIVLCSKRCFRTFWQSKLSNIKLPKLEADMHSTSLAFKCILRETMHTETEKTVKWKRNTVKKFKLYLHEQNLGVTNMCRWKWQAQKGCLSWHGVFVVEQLPVTVVTCPLNVLNPHCVFFYFRLVTSFNSKSITTSRQSSMKRDLCSALLSETQAVDTNIHLKFDIMYCVWTQNPNNSF